ncbi:MAG: hypothetical protein GF331_13870 [Chitinivibrionales bacterium]|nr:hypothetical protein [Chitinivibrionales bacterium]
MGKQSRPTQWTIARASIAAVLTYVYAVMASPAIVLNPYDSVDWASCGRHKANLHTHTTESDGSMSPSTVIDHYHSRGYAVLALADHNEVTYPWLNWGRDPSVLGMVSVQATEASRHDHLGSYFNGYDASSSSITTSLTTIQNNGGLAVIFHPGRYSRSITWYENLYATYDSLIGMEVFNQGDRYPGDRDKWDALLSRTMPGRPVWAFSNDDLHRLEHCARNWQVLLTENATLDSAAVRAAMRTGAFYAVYDGSGDQSRYIALDSLTVAGTAVTVHANCDESAIRWISDGHEIHRGATVDLDTVSALGSYVRAEIHGADGARTLAQPLGIGQVTARERTPHAPSETRRGSSSPGMSFGGLSPAPAGLPAIDLKGRLVAKNVNRDAVTATTPLVRE